MAKVGLGPHETVKMKKEAMVGKTVTLHRFPKISCPIIEEYDDDYLELKSIPFFVNPEIKCFRPGKTVFKVNTHELNNWGTDYKLVAYEFELDIKPVE
jgi:hypothetical protein